MLAQYISETTLTCNFFGASRFNYFRFFHLSVIR